MPATTPADPIELPAALAPAVLAGAEAIEGVPLSVLTDMTPATAEQRRDAALAMFRTAIEARAIVPRETYDDLDAQCRRLGGMNDRLVLQIADIGEKRQAMEQLCHQLADALSGQGVNEAMEAYRRFAW